MYYICFSLAGESMLPMECCICRMNAALPDRSPDQAQVYWERFQRLLQGERGVQGARVSIYIAHLLVPISSVATWHRG